MGARRFGRVNWIGVWTLFRREVLRFFNVYTQTLVAPVITAAMFMAVFTLALAQGRGETLGVAFITFLAPGVVMMTVLQNAFANTSSSIMIAKIQGNIVDTLMPPLSASELTAAIACGGAARGIAVALLASAVLFPIAGVPLAQPLWALFFMVAGSLMMALIGLAAGIWSEKFDHIAAVTNFIITPLSFLSGTFYSIERLPEPFATASLFNPFFYLIDGYRYGAIGVSDASPWIGACVILVAIFAVGALCWRMFGTGYKLKS
ncbi:MAG: ABC transporter permease [Rhodobacteraceae bacterium]|nr:ABC transporter permease [Paracoccaceae bacterium]